MSKISHCSFFYSYQGILLYKIKICLSENNLSPSNTYSSMIAQSEWLKNSISFFWHQLSSEGIYLSLLPWLPVFIVADEFSRAVYVATGIKLTQHLVNTVFKIFDEDHDNKLSHKEFIGIMKKWLHRGNGVRHHHSNDIDPSCHWWPSFLSPPQWNFCQLHPHF